MLSYPLSLALLWLSLLARDISIVASPLGEYGAVHNSSQDAWNQHLTKRTNYLTPSTDELVALFNRNPKYQAGALPSVFFTSLSKGNNPGEGYWTAKRWAEQRFGGRDKFALYTDFFLYSDYLILQDLETSRTVTQRNEYLAHLSKAFARGTAGTAYVVMPDGSDVKQDSYFGTWEAPVLTRRPDWVTEIVRVYVPSNQEASIWKSGDSPLYEPAPPG